MGNKSVCKVPGCGNTRKTKNCSLFLFPKRDPERLAKWCENMGILPVTVYKNTTICDRHFTRSQFSNADRSRLKFTAIPTLLRQQGTNIVVKHLVGDSSSVKLENNITPQPLLSSLAKLNGPRNNIVAIREKKEIVECKSDNDTTNYRQIQNYPVFNLEMEDVETINGNGNSVEVSEFNLLNSVMDSLNQNGGGSSSSSSSSGDLLNDNINNAENIQLARTQITQLVTHLCHKLRKLSRYQSMTTPAAAPLLTKILDLNAIDAYTAFQLSKNYILEQSDYRNSSDVISAITTLENIHHYEIENNYDLDLEASTSTSNNHENDSNGLSHDHDNNNESLLSLEGSPSNICQIVIGETYSLDDTGTN